MRLTETQIHMLRCSNNQLDMSCKSIDPIHLDMCQTHKDVYLDFQLDNNDQEDTGAVYHSLLQIYNNSLGYIVLLVHLSHLLHRTIQVCMFGNW